MSMPSVRRLPFVSWCALLTCLAATSAGAEAGNAASYAGACDASAAVALDAEHFIVGNDETNVLALHRRGQPARVGSVPLGGFLGLGGKDEADIEGAAAVGARVYWITSHARDAKGRAHPGRQRLFATELVPGPPPTVAAVGKPYLQLLEDMLAAPSLSAYPLAAATRRAAEAAGGFNIEGLAATPDGRLLIGLRNPLQQGRALVIPLDNPGEVVLHAQRARFGMPVSLDLGQRGIRSIELVGGSYVIAAGPPGDAGSFALYRWSGRAQDAPTPLPGIALGSLRPEALFALPGSGELMLLSDDGGMRAGGGRCKDLPAARQAFRGLAVQP